MQVQLFIDVSVTEIGQDLIIVKINKTQYCISIIIWLYKKSVSENAMYFGNRVIIICNKIELV